MSRTARHRQRLAAGAPEDAITADEGPRLWPEARRYLSDVPATRSRWALPTGLALLAVAALLLLLAV